MRVVLILLLSSLINVSVGQKVKKLDSVLIFNYPDIGKKDSIIVKKILPFYNADSLLENDVTFTYDGYKWTLKSRRVYEHDSLGRQISKRSEQYKPTSNNFKPFKKDSIAFNGDTSIAFFHRDYKDGFGMPREYYEEKYDSNGRLEVKRYYRLTSNGKFYYFTAVDSFLIKKTDVNRELHQTVSYSYYKGTYLLRRIISNYINKTNEFLDKSELYIVDNISSSEHYKFIQWKNEKIVIKEHYFVQGKLNIKRDSSVYYMRDSIRFDSFEYYSILRNSTYDTAYFIYSLHYDWQGVVCKNIRNKGYYQDNTFSIISYPFNGVRVDTTVYHTDLNKLEKYEKNSTIYYPDGRLKVKKYFRFDSFSDSFRVQAKRYFIYDKPTAAKKIKTKDDGIKVYPNPSSSLVHFEFIENGNVVIFDSSGKIIYSGNNISALTKEFRVPGIYLIKHENQFKKFVITP